MRSCVDGTGAAIAFCVALAIVAYNSRHRFIEDRVVIRRGGLPRDLLEQLGVRLYVQPGNGAQAEGEVDNCSICYQDLTEGDQLRMLPCAHEYHKRCVDKWLRVRASAFCALPTDRVSSGPHHVLFMQWRRGRDVDGQLKS